MESTAGHGEVFSSVFHSNKSLAYKGIVLDPISKVWYQDLKAALRVVAGGFKPETIAKVVAELPPTDPLRSFLTKLMVNTLWGSMLHPPLSYKGPKFQHRSADGQNNNFLIPDLGRAGLPYAKTIAGVRAGNGAKPDPGDLFDMLLSRNDEDDIKESDLGLSSMLLYHADIIIHGRWPSCMYTPCSLLILSIIDIFRTNVRDKNISDTSSYLDLSPLYGKDREAQETVRTMQDGLLKPDTFAEERLLAQPPGVCIYLIMYNRFHNYVAQQIKSINENGKFSRSPGWTPTTAEIEAHAPKATNWDDLDETGREKLWLAKLDEDLFQTARLITCGLYINISIHDYLRVLMRKHAENTSWTLDPRLDMSWSGDKQGIERGIGNQVTIEFNVLYRFHSPISRRDAGWTKRFIQSKLREMGMYPGKKPNEHMTDEQFENGDVPLRCMRQVLTALNSESGSPGEKKGKPNFPDILWLEYFADGEWHWNKIKRGPTGHFSSADLVAEMVRTMEDPICQFGARNVPKFFRSIEILGILQSRKWEMATLNEFREFFGMSRHTSFADVNSDKDIQDALCKMYQHPDLIELYPGLFCEGQGRCLDPGTNCPNGTGTALWRGVFSDAVTLVRSDRFYTLDWNVDTLTSWGMNEVIPDPYTFKGGVMARLFHRAFPGYFKPDSIHMWQPFYTPAMNLILAHQQGLLQELEPGKDCERLGVDGATLGITAKQFKNVMSDEHRQGILGPKAIERYRRAPRASKQPQTNGNVPHQGTSTQRVLSATAEPSRYNPKADVLDLSDSDMRDLLSHQQKLNNAYCALSWYKQLTSNRAADEEALLNKLRFKLLKDRVKMGVPTRPQAPSPISDFDLIKRILEKKDDFKNPGFADETAIPAGPLRSVLSGGELLDEALKIVQKTIGNRTDAEQMFTDYFTTMARYMEEKWRFDMQEYSDKAGTTHQVRQIDIIDGFAIPVITRFLADFLGFGFEIETYGPVRRKVNGKHQVVQEVVYGKYSVADIYDHFTNCQDYLTFDSDEARAFRRRKAFQSSAKFLMERAEGGVKWANSWSPGYKLHKDDPEDVKRVVENMRELGCEVAKDLTKELKNRAEGTRNQRAAAVKLAAALDASHKSIVMFTEVMRCLFTDKNKAHWQSVQSLAKAKDHKEIRKYVLEAQRISVKTPLIRKCAGDVKFDYPNEQSGPQKAEFDKGELLMLDVWKASTAKHPSIDLKYTDEDYLIYGKDQDDKINAKHLTIIAVTGLVAHAATLKDLRQAHDTPGMVKEVETPKTGIEVEDAYRERYMTPKWDEVVPFPTTWSLRYDE